MRVCIVIPFYNESKRLGDLSYLESLELCGNIDFLYVDDGSTDDTLYKLSSKFPNKKIITYEKNRGKGGAIREGLLYSIDKGYDVVGYLDSDGAFTSFDVERIARIAKDIFTEKDNTNMVIASRIKTGSNNIERTMIRSIASYFVKKNLIWSLRNVKKIPTDTQSGFKLIRVTDSLNSFLLKDFKTKWFFDVEIMIGMGYFGFIDEVTLDSWRDVKKSNLGVGSLKSVLAELAIINKIAKIYNSYK
jgi:dolichyl-phosphate beta-glucosyltransferase